MITTLQLMLLCLMSCVVESLVEPVYVFSQEFQYVQLKVSVIINWKKFNVQGHMFHNPFQLVINSVMALYLMA